jgi:hypothetical protein
VVASDAVCTRLCNLIMHGLRGILTAAHQTWLLSAGRAAKQQHIVCTCTCASDVGVLQADTQTRKAEIQANMQTRTAEIQALMTQQTNERNQVGVPRRVSREVSLYSPWGVH